MSKLFASSPNRRAATAIMVLIMLPVMVGFAALTVDVGVLYNTRADLQNAADASALAAAQAYTTETAMQLRMGMSTGSRLVELRNLAFANADSVSTGTMTISVREIQIEREDVSLGWLNTHSATDPISTGTNPATFNAVHVVARRTKESDNGPVQLFFAPIFGQHLAEVSADAVAVLDDRFSGFDAEEDRMLVWPFTVHIDEYTAQFTTGGDGYSYDPDSDTVSSGADGTREITLYPDDQAPGNYGLMNIGPKSLSNEEIKTQLLNSVTADDLESTFGTSELSFFDADGTPTPYNVPGNPGLKSKIEENILIRIGDLVGFFVHDQVTLNGANTVYRIVGMRFGRVMFASLQGASKDRGLWVQPVTYDGAGVRTSVSAPSSHGVAGHVMLSR